MCGNAVRLHLFVRLQHLLLAVPHVGSGFCHEAAQFRTLIVERLTGTVEGYAARAHRCQSGKTVKDWYAERECHIFAGVVLELLAERRMSNRIHIAEERGGHAAGKRDFR